MNFIKSNFLKDIALELVFNDSFIEMKTKEVRAILELIKKHLNKYDTFDSRIEKEESISSETNIFCHDDFVKELMKQDIKDYSTSISLTGRFLYGDVKTLIREINNYQDKQLVFGMSPNSFSQVNIIKNSSLYGIPIMINDNYDDTIILATPYYIEWKFEKEYEGHIYKVTKNEILLTKKNSIGKIVCAEEKK